MRQSGGLRPSIKGPIAFFWLILIVLAYYIYHKPINTTQSLRLIKLTWEFLSPCLITCIAAGLGRRIISLKTHPPLVRLPLQAGLGYGLISIAILAMGALGLYSPIIFFVLSIGLLIFFIKDITAWGHDWYFLKELWSTGGRLGLSLAILIFIILISTLTISLAPPTKFDSLVYHFSLPKTYIELGRFRYIPENMFWGMPQAGEMLFTWAILLSGNSSAAVFGWIWGVLALIGIAGTVYSNFGGRAAWISIAAILAGFSLSASLSWGYIDWLVILFGLGFFVFLGSWRRENSTSNFVLASLFAGMAISVKYTAGILLLPGMLSVFSASRFRFSIYKKLGAAILWILLAILIALPWLIKNVVATGNPIYPFFFPSGSMDQFRIKQYRGTAVENIWLTLFFLPIRATFLGMEAGSGYSAAIGPLLLGFSVLTILDWRKSSSEYRTEIKAAYWILLSGLITWIIASRFSNYLIQTRLYFAILPAVAFLAGAGFYNLDKISSMGVRFGWISGCLVVIVLGFTVYEICSSTIRMGSVQFFFGMKSNVEYLTDNLGWYYPAMQEIRSLPDDAKVLMLWEPRSLYCLPQCVPDEILDRWLRERNPSLGKASTDPNQILFRWRKTGYSYLLFNRVGAEFIMQESDPAYHKDDWIALEELKADLPKIKDFGGVYSLYSLSP
jgi:4-amino-4-deoxy-L-arabinose transferase-like glycosyltransferase